MLEEYADILTTEEACEALRVGTNAMYGSFGESDTSSEKFA